MQNRTTIRWVELYLAIICALGAGFSGDMLAHSAGHATHHGRHTRGNQHRARSGGRDTQGELSHEVDLVKSGAPATSAPSSHLFVAILPTIPVVSATWTRLGFVLPLRAGFIPAVERLQPPARAPPT